MNGDLQKMTDEWMQLERKTLEQRKIAEEFYEHNLMNLIRDDYILRNRKKVTEKVDYLVISVGTSYEPIVLNISLFKPSKILFLYTQKTEGILDKIVQFCDLSISSFDKSLVSETDPISIYQKIKDAYLFWGRPKKMYIDFTGGTKAMSAAAAMAGAVIDVQLIYAGSDDYLSDFRKPKPGSETLYFIENPLSVFGDLEIEKAFQLFGQFNFAGAGQRLKVLQETLPDPDIRQQMEFAYLLAKAYESWDALDLVPACDFMTRLDRSLERDQRKRTFLLMDQRSQIARQKEILEEMKKIPELIREKKNFQILQTDSIIHSLMFTLYQNALTREKQEKYDMATLLFYRLLEMIEQKRLARYHLFVSAMNYEDIQYTVPYHPGYAEAEPQQRIQLLKNDMQEIKEQLFGKPGNGYLPDQVSLLEGFIILFAFRDPIVYRNEKEGLNALKRIRAMVHLRNNSIFAHGLGPVMSEDFMKFRSFVEKLFIEFCKIEQIPFYKTMQSYCWIDPMKTTNYASNVENAVCQSSI